VTPSPGGKQFAQVVREMKKLDLKRVPAFAAEPMEPGRTVGLVFDFDQLWYYLTLPQAKRWNQGRWLISWYAALSRLGMRVQIIRPGMPWPNDLPLVVAPGVQMVEESLVSQMDAWTRAGGHLVLTCRTGLMDRNGQLWEGPTAKPILPLIGASIDSYDGLREAHVGHVKFEGKDYDWSIWGEQLVPSAGTQTLATYSDQFYAGAAAITRANLGKGSVSYFGVYSEPPLVDAFMQSLAKSIGGDRLRATALENRVQLLRRGPYRIALNYNDKPVAAPAPLAARFIVGSAEIGPADVAVWEE
jgi:beta-galactosidase